MKYIRKTIVIILILLLLSSCTKKTVPKDELNLDINGKWVAEQDSSVYCEIDGNNISVHIGENNVLETEIYNYVGNMGLVYIKPLYNQIDNIETHEPFGIFDEMYLSQFHYDDSMKGQIIVPKRIAIGYTPFPAYKGGHTYILRRVDEKTE